MTEKQLEAARRAVPCPWCKAEATEQDEWGWLITHKPTCYWLNVHGDPIGRVRVNFSEVKQWNQAAADLLQQPATSERCTCGHRCPSRYEVEVEDAQCEHAPDCELMRGVVTTGAGGGEQRDVCWHCRVVLSRVPRPRCEDCPEECDAEGCEADGCAPATVAEGESPYYAHIKTCASCGAHGLCSEGAQLYNAPAPAQPAVARDNRAIHSWDEAGRCVNCDGMIYKHAEQWYHAESSYSSCGRMAVATPVPSTHTPGETAREMKHDPRCDCGVCAYCNGQEDVWGSPARSTVKTATREMCDWFWSRPKAIRRSVFEQKLFAVISRHFPPTETTQPQNAAAIALLDKWLNKHPRVECDEALERLLRSISENGLPDRETTQSQAWCDHCSADLNGVQHILCEHCYREYAGPKSTGPAFNAEATQVAVEVEPLHVRGFATAGEFLDAYDAYNAATIAHEIMEQIKTSCSYGAGYQFTIKCEEDIAAIVSKYCADAGEVEQLKQRARDAEKWIADVEEREVAACPEDTPFDEYIRHLGKKLTEARANAIRECARLARSKSEEYRETAQRWGAKAETENNLAFRDAAIDDRNQCLSKHQAMLTFATALESLAKEGDDGSKRLE